MQGCLSHLFSAHDSLFFANCNCENGEAAALFGGPYTVTMHKSSLVKISKMHNLRAQARGKKKIKGQTLKRMLMLRAYSTRLRWTRTDITTP